MIYTVYSHESDMTFIVKETKEDNKTIISVVGFYFGEPNEEATKEFNGSLTAVVEKEFLSADKL